MAGNQADMELDGMAGMPSLGFEDVDLEMLAAGPAEVQYNEIMEKDVLQYFGLFGTAADTAQPASVAGSGGGSGPGSGSGSGGNSVPTSRGPSGIGAQLLLGGSSAIGAQMLLGGGSAIGSSLLLAGGSGIGAQLLLGGGSGMAPALGSAAQHVEALLAGTHPSMRGGTLADWLAAEGPIVSMTQTGLPDNPAGAGGQVVDVQVRDPGTALSSTGPMTSSPAPPHMLVQASAPHQQQQQQQQQAPMLAQPMQQQPQIQLQPAQQALQLHLQGGMLAPSVSPPPLASTAPPPGSASTLPMQQPVQFQHQSQPQQAPMVLQLPGAVPMLHPAFYASTGGSVQAPPATNAGWMQQAQQHVSYYPQQQQQQQQQQMPLQFQPLQPSNAGLHQQPLQQDSSGIMQMLLGEALAISPAASSGGSGGAAPAIPMGAPSTAAGPALSEPLLPMVSVGDLPLMTSGDGAAAMPQAPLPHAGLSGLPSTTVRTAPSASEGEVTEVSGMSGGGGGAVEQKSAGAQPSNKRFSDRQKAKISNLEAELSKLQESMAQVKLENERLKSKNLEVEHQLRTQEQLQQLAAVAVTAGAQHQARQHQRHGLDEQQLAAGVVVLGSSPNQQGLHAPPLGVAVGLSPPNSQRKLLAHLSGSMRPAEREMRTVAALTWPKLQEWYCQLLTKLGEVLVQAPSLSPAEADQAAKEALKGGHYWDLLVLISRPDLSSKLIHEDLSAGLPAASLATAAAATKSLAMPPDAPGSWPAAAVEALQLSTQQRQALAAVWHRHQNAAEQRAQRKQELLTAIRSGFLQPLQRAAPEDVELGKPLAAQGLEAMESLRLVVRQDHVSAVQIACGVRKLLSPLQQARLMVAAWPWYPYPSKWAPLLVESGETSDLAA